MTTDWSRQVRVRQPLLRLAWVRLAGSVAWDLFVTLTFDPKRVYPVGSERAAKEAVRWCGDVARTLRRPVGWLIAPERMASGQWHAHVLLVGVPKNIGPLAAIWEMRNGSIDVQVVRDGAAVVLYATKDAALS